MEGKGLKADNTAAAGEGKAYSALEHAWDEGFGYFGANRTYGSLTDDEIKARVHDADGSGTIDIKTEYIFGASINAAKRDLGSAEGAAPTDFTSDAWNGFLGGRAIIAGTETALTEAEMADLVTHRDMAVEAWEKAVAATVVHYINDMIQDLMAASPSTEAEYDFATYAKHWSEAKGFALWFQFNPYSPMGSDDFAALHDALGLSPTLPSGDYMSYYTGLLEARALLGEIYGFDAANMGDDYGENGW